MDIVSPAVGNGLTLLGSVYGLIATVYTMDTGIIGMINFGPMVMYTWCLPISLAIALLF